MSVAPGCHRRPPLRMAPLPRPLAGRRNPQHPQTGAPASAGPHPDPDTQGKLEPPALVPRPSPLHKQAALHVVSHRRSTETAHSASSSHPGATPSHPSGGRSRPPSTPTPGQGGGGGLLKRQAHYFSLLTGPAGGRGCHGWEGWPSPPVRGIFNTGQPQLRAGGNNKRPASARALGGAWGPGPPPWARGRGGARRAGGPGPSARAASALLIFCFLPPFGLQR